MSDANATNAFANEVEVAAVCSAVRWMSSSVETITRQSTTSTSEVQLVGGGSLEWRCRRPYFGLGVGY